MEDREKIMQSSAHKYFWVFVLISFVIIVMMILFSSFNQERMKIENEQISEQLTEEKNSLIGLKKTARNISEQNDKLLQENKILKEENETLKEELLNLQRQNEDYQNNKELVVQLNEAYVAGDMETCQQLLLKIKEEMIFPEDLEQYTAIKEELTK